MAVRTMADALSRGGSAYASDDDPELVRQALPFGLKTLEGLLVELPHHRPLLRALASGFTSYGVAFVVVWFSASLLNALQQTNVDEVQLVHLRAEQIYAADAAWEAVERSLAGRARPEV